MNILKTEEQDKKLVFNQKMMNRCPMAEVPYVIYRMPLAFKMDIIRKIILHLLLNTAILIH